jgi:hypothetical protein
MARSLSVEVVEERNSVSLGRLIEVSSWNESRSSAGGRVTFLHELSRSMQHRVISNRMVFPSTARPLECPVLRIGGTRIADQLPAVLTDVIE